MDRVELPGKVHRGIDGVGLEQVPQLAPGRGEVKAEEARFAGHLRFTQPDVQAEDELHVRFSTEPRNQLLRKVPAASGDCQSRCQGVLPFATHSPRDRGLQLHLYGLPAALVGLSSLSAAYGLLPLSSHYISSAGKG